MICGGAAPSMPTAWLACWKKKSAASRRVKVVWKVEANGVFAQIPRHAIEKIKQHYFFYTWMEEESIVRWMCSFDTTEDDIRKFAEVVAEAVKG